MPENGTVVKPRWVECADKAADVLEAARNAEPADRETIVAEADAWIRLAYCYRDGGGGGA